MTTPSGLRSRVCCCCCCYIYRSSLHLVKVLGACTERKRQLSSETIDNSAGISFFASSISLSIPHYHRSIPPLQCMARAAPTGCPTCATPGFAVLSRSDLLSGVQIITDSMTADSVDLSCNAATIFFLAACC